eukprot:363408-Chlamydomonas_euryale.AAC.2
MAGHCAWPSMVCMLCCDVQTLAPALAASAALAALAALAASAALAAPAASAALRLNAGLEKVLRPAPRRWPHLDRRFRCPHFVTPHLTACVCSHAGAGQAYDQPAAHTL